MIIDFHVHYQNITGFLDKVLSVCDGCGVERICLNGAGQEWGQFGNDEVEKAFKQYPNRIIGFGFIKLGLDKPEIVDGLYHRGFKGLKTQNPLAPYDDQSFYPFYERAEKCGMPILFHTGIGARGKFPRSSYTSSDYMRPIKLDAIARHFTELNIVAAHMGIPWCAEAAFMSIIHPNFYFDLAGVDRTEKIYPSILNIKEQLMWHPNGLKKLLYGTEGGPDIIAEVKHEYESLLQRYNVNETVKSAVMGMTAAKLVHLV